MIRGLFALALLTLTLTAATPPAGAFVLSRGPLNGDWSFERWPDGTKQVRYVLNEQPFEMLPNLATGSEPLAAIQAAMQSWAIAPVPLSLDNGTTPITDAARDGTNLLSFADTPGNRDMTAGNRLALTTVWLRSQGGHWNINEVDTVFNPTVSFATDGSTGAYDLQGVLTHELGHALGLNHSAITAVTMYPYTDRGRLEPRVLGPDDVAGMGALYGISDATTGAVSGRVVTTAGDPVLGAHVVATNADGVTMIGGLTDADGNYTLPALPPGSYQVYAEPLNGLTTPANYGDYYQDALTTFRPAFVGGDLTATPVTVAAGQTTALDPLTVDPEADSVTFIGIGWSSSDNGFHLSSPFPSPLHAGDSLYLVVLAPNLDAVPDDGFHFSGSDLQLDLDNVVRGTTTLGHSFALVPLTVHRGAAPGPRNLYLDTGTEQAIYTGAVVVSDE